MIELFKPRSRDRLGYTRLKGELQSYRIELKRAAERVEQADESDPPWLDEAQALLDQVEEALNEHRIEEGWFHLNTARRIELDSLLTDKKALAVQAKIALAEASSLPDPWIREIVPLLVTYNPNQPQTDDDLSITEIRAARYILDREYQQTFLRRRYVREQFSGLTLIGIVSVTLFVLITLVGWSIFGNSASPFQAGASQQPWFLLYVLLSGTIGASLFGIISSIRADPRIATLPQTISSGWMVIARILIGTMSAFVLYLFIRSNILNFGDSPEASILLISLAAGYSERLAPQALAAVSDKIAVGFDNEGSVGSSGSTNTTGVPVVPNDSTSTQPKLTEFINKNATPARSNDRETTAGPISDSNPTKEAIGNPNNPERESDSSK